MSEGTDLLAWKTAIATMADITTNETNAPPAGFIRRLIGRLGSGVIEPHTRAAP